MQDISTKPFAFQQRVQDCRTLYTAYQGRHHEEIELEMRRLGHTTFNRRVLYARNERGRRTPGWPEKYGWNGSNGKLRIENGECGLQIDVAGPGEVDRRRMRMKEMVHKRASRISRMTGIRRA